MGFDVESFGASGQRQRHGFRAVRTHREHQHLRGEVAGELLEPSRVAQAREAVDAHYSMQRARYGEAFEKMGLSVYTGDGGFYHWLKLPDGLDFAPATALMQSYCTSLHALTHRGDVKEGETVLVRARASAVAAGWYSWASPIRPAPRPSTDSPLTAISAARILMSGASSEQETITTERDRPRWPRHSSKNG